MQCIWDPIRSLRKEGLDLHTWMIDELDHASQSGGIEKCIAVVSKTPDMPTLLAASWPNLLAKQRGVDA